MALMESDIKNNFDVKWNVVENLGAPNCCAGTTSAKRYSRALKFDRLDKLTILRH